MVEDGADCAKKGTAIKTYQSTDLKNDVGTPVTAAETGFDRLMARTRGAPNHFQNLRLQHWVLDAKKAQSLNIISRDRFLEIHTERSFYEDQEAKAGWTIDTKSHQSANGPSSFPLHNANESHHRATPPREINNTTYRPLLPTGRLPQPPSNVDLSKSPCSCLCQRETKTRGKVSRGEP